MNRLQTISLAVFLGLINAQDLMMQDAQFLQDTGSIEKAMQAKEYASDKAEDLTRLNCLLYNDLTFFDLRVLEKGNTYKVAGHNFNFCRRLKDEDGEKTFAYSDVGSGFLDSTTRLTGGGKPQNIKSVVNDTDANAPRHIYFEIDGGEECAADKKKNYKVIYEVFCDAEAKDIPTLFSKNLDLTDKCAPKLSFTHASGCPVFQATSIVRYLSENPWALGAILIVFGTIVTFWGGKFFPYVLASVAGGITFLAILLLASILGALIALEKGKQSTPGEITLAVMSLIVALGLAVFVGFFIKRIQRTGLTALGAVAGFFVGFLLYTFVFIQWLQHVGLLIASCGIGALLFGFLAYKFDRHIIIYLTSFIGAYAFIRGISMYAGKFPNEIFLIQQLKNNAFDGLGWEFYLYLVAIVILGVLGCIRQFRQNYHKHDDEYVGYHDKDDNFKKAK
ncbi:UNKNOWN [Stylonychia lemnae]|uniref:Transmembrane protein 198 n=1 Tax=Stylonychia lemnae TaxID=5949 RepID=A0A078A6N8_STYLE|nr:UNKNOWN [Stylonychia lemnae]|eukprot:CDW77915.1 UNKNOWN [Stylonychia lemnae]